MTATYAATATRFIPGHLDQRKTGRSARYRLDQTAYLHRVCHRPRGRSARTAPTPKQDPAYPSYVAPVYPSYVAPSPTMSFAVRCTEHANLAIDKVRARSHHSG